MAASRSLILNASPYAGGHCSRLTDLLATWYERFGEVERLKVSDLAIAACRGCNACRERSGHSCVISDEMDEVNRAFDEADRLIIVSPVYFAGPPSQLKALYDRLQPHYWRQTRKRWSKPCSLWIVGAGGDPHGFDPLETITRSACAVAGFRLEQTNPVIGEARKDLDLQVSWRLDGEEAQND